MPIIEPAIRPPAEAESFLLQITTGCSANSCTFCGAYLRKPFKFKDQHEIDEDIKLQATYYPETRRVFLIDGDALAISNSKLLPILEQLNSAFPKLNRIASYANGYNITTRDSQELQQLYRQKLRLIYLGLESGSQLILDKCRKRSTVTEMIEAVRRADEIGIKSSVMVLLGLGGKEYSKEHVQESINALNQMQPRYLSFLTLMLIPGTPLYEEAQAGFFQELNPQELLLETHAILSGLKLNKTIFRCDHASNYLPLEGRLPTDQKRLLQTLDMAIEGKIKLKSEYFRAL